MRIIVIEDNELYKNELLQCLEQEESDIEIVGSASNGAEGLALTEKLIRDNLTPDVIFTDVRMPEMDGFEMIEALQRRGISCKIVVTSSCPEFLYAKRAMELGAVDFLVKPLKVYEVRNVLGRLRRELESEKKWKHILNLEFTIDLIAVLTSTGTQIKVASDDNIVFITSQSRLQILNHVPLRNKFLAFTKIHCKLLGTRNHLDNVLIQTVIPCHFNVVAIDIASLNRIILKAI